MDFETDLLQLPPEILFVELIERRLDLATQCSLQLTCKALSTIPIPCYIKQNADYIIGMLQHYLIPENERCYVYPFVFLDSSGYVLLSSIFEKHFNLFQFLVAQFHFKSNLDYKSISCIAKMLLAFDRVDLFDWWLEIDYPCLVPPDEELMAAVCASGNLQTFERFDDPSKSKLPFSRACILSAAKFGHLKLLKSRRLQHSLGHDFIGRPDAVALAASNGTFRSANSPILTFSLIFLFPLTALTAPYTSRLQ